MDSLPPPQIDTPSAPAPARPRITVLVNQAPPLPGLINDSPAGIRAVNAADGYCDEEMDLAEASRAANTWRAYRSDWKDFEGWCKGAGQSSMPASPEVVSAYLRNRAGALKISTLALRLTSITVAHQARGLESPVKSARVQMVWKGLKRTKGVAPEQKAPAVLELVRRMVEAAPEGVVSKNARARELLVARDRALLAMGFFGAFRRSELAGLLREDVGITREGLVITIRRSKTNQEGALEQIGLPAMESRKVCPVRLLTTWLKVSGIETGPLFRAVSRHGKLGGECIAGFTVARVVKRTVKAIGLDPADYAGHSLRAGFATTAARAGATNREIKKTTRHKSDEMVSRYVRRGTLFEDTAAKRMN